MAYATGEHALVLRRFCGLRCLSIPRRPAFTLSGPWSKPDVPATKDSTQPPEIDEGKLERSDISQVEGEKQNVDVGVDILHWINMFRDSTLVGVTDAAAAEDINDLTIMEKLKAGPDHRPEFGAPEHAASSDAVSELPSQVERYRFSDAGVEWCTAASAACHRNGSGILRNRCAVGDALSATLAWCLQPAPCGRLPMAGVAALLRQLLPGQTWTDGGSTPGTPAPLLVALQDGSEDASSVAAARLVATVKALASGSGVADQEAARVLPILERRAAGLLRDGDLVEARNAFLDLFTAHNRLRVASKDRTGASCGREEQESSWVDEKVENTVEERRIELKMYLGLSEVWERLGEIEEAAKWQARAEATFCDLDNVCGSGTGGEVGKPFELRYACEDELEELQLHGRRGAERKGTGIRERQLIEIQGLFAEVMAGRGQLLLAREADSAGISCLPAAAQCFRIAASVVQRTLSAVVCARSVTYLQGYAAVLEARGRIAAAKAAWGHCLDSASMATGYCGRLAADSLAGQTLEALARICVDAEEFDTAEGHLLRAIRLYESLATSGEEGVSAPRALLALGRCWRARGRYGAAAAALADARSRCLVQEALWVRRGRHLGPLLLLRAAVALELADYRSATLDYGAALEAFRKQLVVPTWARDSTADYSSSPAAQCHAGLGECSAGQGRYWDALQCYEEAHRLLLAKFPTGAHSCIADARERLGITWHQLGRPGLALEWICRALESRQAAQGVIHPGIGAAALSAAAVCRTAGLLQRAADNARAGLTILVAAHGLQHSLVVRALAEAALCAFPLALLAGRKQVVKHRLAQKLLAEAEGEYSACAAALEKAQEAELEGRKRTAIKRADLNHLNEERQKRQDVLNLAASLCTGKRAVLSEASQLVRRAFDRADAAVTAVVTAQQALCKCTASPHVEALERRLKDAKKQMSAMLLKEQISAGYSVDDSSATELVASGEGTYTSLISFAGQGSHGLRSSTDSFEWQGSNSLGVEEENIDVRMTKLGSQIDNISNSPMAASEIPETLPLDLPGGSQRTRRRWVSFVEA